uniref:Exonuclease n=1 Tax=Nitrosopumivirus cobalaminus TaxID=3158414 RepID=A0AAU7N495_9VIRU
MSIHVSDIVGCGLRSWYRVHEKIKEPESESSMFNFFMGHLIHEEIILSEENELYMQGNIESMEVDCTDSNERLVGSMDNIIEIDGEKVICDTKTCFRLPKEDELPEGYRKQLNLYKLLYYIETGIEVKKGAILWLEKMTSLKNHKANVIELDELVDIRKMALDRMRNITGDKAPEPETHKWCKYCPYYKTDKCDAF